MLKGGALTVGFALAGLRTQCALAQAAAAPRVLDAKEVDAFLAVNGDGTVTLYTAARSISAKDCASPCRQIAAEELGIGIDKIKYVEGDTALTPDQGRTSGSNGIQRGGMQIRQAAATARKALIELAAQRLNAQARRPDRDRRRSSAEGRRRRHRLCRVCSAVASSTSSSIPRRRSKILRATPSSASRCRGRTCRPNAPGSHVYVQDFSVPGMLHAPRDPAARDRRHA